MTKNPLVRLSELGQSPWYDYITRDLLASGRLASLIAEDGLLGMTSNPTIFEKAISGSDLYDDDIRAGTEGGLDAAAIFERLAVADVRQACDIFGPVYEESGRRHGFVSLEVSPDLANDTAGTIEEAARLWREVSRPNAMIKIPGTTAGLPAITASLAAGININVTLLFAVSRYEEVIEAFLTGLEQRAARGDAVNGLDSVASFFVSRVDSKVDPALDKLGNAGSLRGKAAIANARTAYAAFERSLDTPRWRALADLGARVQRPLWASTSTKDPAYPDVYYVEALIAPDTVNTMTPATFDAYRDHGKPAVRIWEGMARARDELAALAAAGINLADVTETLEREGVASFADSYHSLLEGIDSKSGALTRR